MDDPSFCPIALIHLFVQCRGSASHLTQQEEATAKEVAANPPSHETEGPEVTAES